MYFESPCLFGCHNFFVLSATNTVTQPRKALIVICRHDAYRLRGFSHELHHRFDDHLNYFLSCAKTFD